jgi:excisionase family DNA binding protein
VAPIASFFRYHKSSFNMTATPTASSPPILFTEQQASEALSLSPGTLYGLRRRGEIPFVKIGRSIRYIPSTLDAWVRSQAIQTPPSCN